MIRIRKFFHGGLNLIAIKIQTKADTRHSCEQIITVMNEIYLNLINLWLKKKYT